MIKNIIFDIGNVIYYFDIDKIVKEYTDNKEDQEFIKDEIFNSPEWAKYDLIDTGYIDLETAISLIQDRTNHIKDYLVEDFLNRYPDYGYIDERTINLVHELKDKGYKIYLLSNISESFLSKVDLNSLFESVDGYVLSYECHQIKPHIGIYNTLINKFDLDPKECIFIDDREDNVRTANLLGIHGKHVDARNFDSIIDLLDTYKVVE